MTSPQYIIIAEDDKTYANIYRVKLEHEGYEVLLITRGDEVVPELKRRQPDLLVLDLIMPGATGFDVLEAIRADANLKNLKVIVASNLSQDIDRDSVKKYGVVDYFVKSDVSITEMVTKIKQAL